MLRTHRLTRALACLTSLVATPALAQTAPAPAPAAPAPAAPAPAAPAAAPAEPAPAAPAAEAELPTPTDPAPAPAPELSAAPAPAELQPPIPLEAPAAPPAPDEEAKPPAEVGYDKGFFIKQGANSLNIQGRVQPRFTHVAFEGDVEPNRDAFELARAQLYFKGTAYRENLSYKVQIDLGRGSAFLKDFYFDYCVADDMLCIRPGQFKRPFNRQQIVSDSSFEFVDRSITDRAFGGSRDIGLMLHDNYEKSPTFEYAIGLFNGTGERSTFSGSGTADADTGEVDVESGSFSNVPAMWHPALGLRLGYNHGEIKGYSEADLEGGGFRFAIAGSLESHFDADRGDDTLVKMEADAVIKIEGFSISGAVFRTSQQEGAGFSDRTTGDGGAYAQAGYVIGKLFQPVLRYGIVDPRHDQSNNIEEEFTGGLNFYFDKHDLKWQSDLTALNHNSDDTTDWQFRTQAQLTF